MTRKSLIAWTSAIVVVAVVLATLSARSASRKESATSQSSTSTVMQGMPGVTGQPNGSISVTADQIRQFGITFGTAQLRPLSDEVRTTGIVAVDETRLAKVTPKFSGYVEQLYANFVGQYVRRGQVLAAVFSPDLVAAEQELIVSSRLSRTIGNSTVPGVPGTTTDLLSAAKERLRLWDVSESQIAEVLRTGKASRTVPIVAPTSGVILDKKVVLGQAIQAGEELYTIADLSDVWVDAQLREEDAGRVGVGATAVLQFTSAPGRPYTGRVTYIYPTLTEQARTVKARVAVPNGDGRLKPGMYATVTITTSTASALTVPRSAVIQTGERALVFVDHGSGKLMAHTVRLGRSGSDYVEVLSGLDAGQRVVTSAQFLLDSESNLAEVMKTMIGQGAQGEGMTTPAASDVNEKGADMRGMPGMTSPPKR